MRRFPLRAAGLLAIALAAITCTDATTGPGGLRGESASRLRMAPSFSPSALRALTALEEAGVTVTQVHILLRASDGSVAKDTTIAFPASQDTLTVQLPVQIQGSEQSFTATLDLLDASDVVLFSRTLVVTARANSLPEAPMPPFVLQYVGPGHLVRAVTLSPTGLTLPPGVATPLVATAVDSGGAATSNLIVSWRSSDTTLATVASTGRATATVTGTGRRGTVTITATSPTGIAGTAQFTMLPQPTSLVVVSGNGQAGVAGRALAQPLVVELRGLDNLPIAGSAVVVTAVTTGGAVGAAPGDTLLITDAAGRVSVSLTLGRTAGTYAFQARAGTLLVPPVTALATPAPATVLTIVSGDAQSAAASSALPQPFVVRATNEFGDAVSDATVGWTRAAGGGTLAAVSSLTDAQGLASMTYRLGTRAGADSVRATLSGVTTPAGSVVLTSTTAAGAPARLSWLVAPADPIVVGAAFPPFSARVVDAFGNPVRVAGTRVLARGRATNGVVTDSSHRDSTATDTAGIARFAVGPYLGIAGQLTITLTSPGLDSLASSVTTKTGTGSALTIVSGIPATVPSGVAIAPAVVVQVTDAGGNPVAGSFGITASLAAGAGTLGGPLAVSTTSDGRATFTGLTISGAAGSYALRFGATGMTGIVSPAIAVTGGVPSSLAIVAGAGQTGPVGTALPIRPTVRVTDANGNPVRTGRVIFSARTGSTVAPDSVRVGADGLASTSWTLGFVAGVDTLVARLDSSALAPVTFTATATPGAPTQFVIVSGDGQTAAAGTAVALPPSVRAADARGNGVAGVRVTFRAIGSLSTIATGTTTGDSVQVETGANGVASLTSWTLGTAARSYVVEATTTPAIIANALGFTATATAGSATRFVTTTSSSTPVAGQPVAVAAQLVDAAGNLVRTAGRTVTWSASASGGGFSSATSATDANGVAQVSYTTPTTAGVSIVVTATDGPVTGSTPAITTVAGSGTALGFAGGGWLVSGTTRSGDPFAPQPLVQLLDASGNAVATPGVVVTASVASGPTSLAPTLAGASATTDAAGRATFTSLALTGASGTYTLAFTASAYAPISSGTLQLGAGVANRLAFTTQPPSTTAALSPFAFSVALLDATGNVVTTSTEVVSVALLTGSGRAGASLRDGGGAARATVTRTAVNGVASFTGIAIDSAGTGYVLAASTSALPSGGASSTAVNVTVGPGAQLTLTGTQATTAASGAALSPQPTVQLRDAAGNAVTLAGVTVTAAIASGTGTLSNLTAVTDAAGSATFAGLTISGPAGSVTLSIAATGYTSVVHAPVGIVAGAATQLTFLTAPPATAASAVAFAPQPVLQLRDASGNASPTSGVSVTVAIAAGTGSLIGAPTVTTDAAGQARYAGLGISGQAGSFALSFTSGSLTSASASVTLSAGAPSAMTVLPSNLAPVAGSGVTVQIQLRDASGNPAREAGHTIAWSASIAGGSFGSPTSVTDASGIAQVVYTTPTTAGTPVVLTGTEGSITGSSPAIVPVAGAASQLRFDGGWSPGTQASGSVFVPQPVVQVTDANGNPVAQSGLTVTSAVATGPAGSTIAGAAVTTDAAGRAAFTGLKLAGTAGNYTLAFTADGFPVLASATLTLSGGAATRFVFTSTPPQPTITGAEFDFIVTALDALDNVASGYNSAVVIDLIRDMNNRGSLHDSTGAAVAPLSMNAVNGVAHFRRVSVDSIGTYSLKAYGIGNSITTSGSFNVITGLATQVTPAGPLATSAQSGVALSPQPALKLVDGAGRDVAQAGVTMTAAVTSGSASVTNATAVTNASGVATFAGLTVSGTQGSVSLTFSAPGLNTTIHNFTLNAGAPGMLGLFTAPSATATSGTPFSQQPVIQVQDGAGNALATMGTSVSVAITSGSGSLIGSTTATTDATGKATFSGLGINGVAGSFTLTFTSTGLASATANVTVSAGTAGAATHFVLVSGGNQSATVTQPLASPLVFEARDANQVPVPNTPFVVNYDRNTGRQGYIRVTGLLYDCDCYPPRDSILTDGNGRASMTWTVSSMAKVDTVAIGNAAIGFSPATATALAGPATQLVFVAPNGLDDDLGNVLRPFSVIFSDIGGYDTVAVNGPVTLTLVGTGVMPETGYGTASGTLTVTAVNGVATFSDIQISKTGTYYFTATGGGFSNPSQYFTISPAGPHFVVVGSYPSTAAVGSPVTIQLRSETAHGAALPNTPVIVSNTSGGLALTNGAFGGTRDSTRTDANGNVTLTWTMPSTTGYLSTSVFNYETASTLQLTVQAVAGPATQIVASHGTLNGEVGTPLQTITVNAADGAGNLDYSASGTVTASLVGGDPAATLGGTLTRSLPSAYFTGLTIDKPGTYRIRFTSGSFVVETPAFTIAAIPATQNLTLTGSNQILIAPNGSRQVTLTATDGQGAPVAGQPVTLFSYSNATCGVGALGASTQTMNTGANGEATFTVLSGATLNGCLLNASAPAGPSLFEVRAQGVVYSGPASHIWFGNGAVPGSYDAPSNWVRTNGAVPVAPEAFDTAWIPGDLQYHPIVPSPDGRSLGGLTLATSALLDLGGSTLMMYGDVNSVNATISAGTIAMAGAGRNVTGNIEQLRLGNPGNCASDSTRVQDASIGQFTVVCSTAIGAGVTADDLRALAGSRVTMPDGSATLAVNDSLIVDGSSFVIGGTLSATTLLLSPSVLDVQGVGYISAGGNATLGRDGGTIAFSAGAGFYGGGETTFRGTGQSSGSLYSTGTVRFAGSLALPEGLLALDAGFEQLASAPNAFRASGTHTVQFNGAVAQGVVLPSPATSYFAHLQIQNVAAAVTLPTGARIGGNASLAANSRLTMADATVTGYISAASGSVLTMNGANSAAGAPYGLYLYAGSTWNILAGTSFTGGCTRPNYPGDGVTINGGGTLYASAQSAGVPASSTSCTPPPP